MTEGAWLAGAASDAERDIRQRPSSGGDDDETWERRVPGGKDGES